MPGAVTARGRVTLPGAVQAAIGPGKTAVALNASGEKERRHLSTLHRKLKSAGCIQSAAKGAVSQKASAYYKISLKVSTALCDRIKRHR